MIKAVVLSAATCSGGSIEILIRNRSVFQFRQQCKEEVKCARVSIDERDGCVCIHSHVATALMEGKRQRSSTGPVDQFSRVDFSSVP